MNSNAGFELHGLQKLFATSLPAVNEPRGSFNPVKIRERVTAEVARVKQRLLENVFTIEGEDAIRRYVQLHQYALISVMDKVFLHPVQPAAIDCYDALAELLSFLEEHFPDCFNDRAKAPLWNLTDIQMKVNVCLPQLARSFQNGRADPAIIEMILHPLRRLIMEDVERVSFSRIRHVTYILIHAEKISDCGCQRKELNRQLLQLLLYLNYNSKKTFIQLTEYVHGLLPSHLDICEKIDYLSYILKEANQATVKPGTGYHPHAPTLKSQLVCYITAELTYLVNIREQAEIPQVKPEPAASFKVKLDLSVAQLACLLRLCTETGLIASGNTSALIRFVALNCETKRAGQISAESLRIRFYDIEDGTRRAVQEMLAEVLKSAETGL